MHIPRGTRGTTRDWRAMPQSWVAPCDAGPPSDGRPAPSANRVLKVSRDREHDILSPDGPDQLDTDRQALRRSTGWNDDTWLARKGERQRVVEHRIETFSMEVRRSGAGRTHDDIERSHEREHARSEVVP